MSQYVASVSFGKDSLAMLLILLETGAPLDEVIFYDTGMEFKAIYDTRDRVIPMLEAAGVKYTELRPKNPFLYDMLERPVFSEKNGHHAGYGWCGGRPVGHGVKDQSDRQIRNRSGGPLCGDRAG